jgi:hypothetical protein
MDLDGIRQQKISTHIQNTGLIASTVFAETTTDRFARDLQEKSQ